MDVTLGRFIEALRHAGLPISPAETLDAIRAAELVGVGNVRSLRSALSLVLAKSLEHKETYERLFAQFFFAHDRSLDQSSPESESEESSGSQALQDASESSAADDGEGSAEGADGSLPDADGSLPEGADGSSQEGAPEAGQNQSSVSSPLGQQLLANDSSGLATAMAIAAEQEDLREMQVFTQKSRFSYRIMQRLGNDELNAELAELNQDEGQAELYRQLIQRRDILQQQVRDYVEQQFVLFAADKGRQLRRENLQKIKLTNIDLTHYKLMGELVRKAAKQLASMHSRRRRVTRRGLLDVRKTVAANAAFDGILFHTKWRSTRIDRPKVMVICDVSGSVSRVARFLLLFVYSLQDVMPRVRSFVFASNMGEVTEHFKRLSMDEALAEVMSGWANQSTSYDQSLQDFQQLALNEIDNKTTVIMLGDARNNKAPGREDIWQEVYRRSQRVLWLNPERKTSWNTGDSIMADYAPYCSRVETCNSLRDLNRIIGSLLKHS
jgi:uncharacterized protein